MYDPSVGRWLEEDPLGLEPDSNPHRYVDNGPTNSTDPTGLFKGARKTVRDLTIRETAKVKAFNGVIDGQLEVGFGKLYGDRGIYIAYSGKNADQVCFLQVIHAEITYVDRLGGLRRIREDGTFEYDEKVYGKIWNWQNTARNRLSTSTPKNRVYYNDTAPGKFYYSDYPETSGQSADKLWIWDSPNTSEIELPKVLKDMKTLPKSATFTEYFDTFAVYEGKVFGRVSWEASSKFVFPKSNPLPIPKAKRLFGVSPTKIVYSYIGHNRGPDFQAKYDTLLD
jgi:hypothetical protein